MYTDTIPARNVAFVASPARPLNSATAESAISDLLEAARSGDPDARQALCARCLPQLRSWARKCVRRDRCGIQDADDLVQITMLRVLDRIGTFQAYGNGGFVAYLRQILINEFRGELRRQRGRGEAVEFTDCYTTDDDPVIDHLLDFERQQAFLAALSKLKPRQQRHIALRIEHGLSFREIAGEVGGSADSARMIVTRAVRAMGEHLTAAAA